VNESAKLGTQPVPAAATPSLLESGTFPKRLRSFGWAGLALVLCFAFPLFDLMRFAITSTLYSYILLIPFISFYLVWTQRRNLPCDARPANKLGMLFLLLGGAATGIYWLALRDSSNLMETDYLAIMMLCFVLFFLGICGLFWGKEILRQLAFPLGFIFFMVPIPAIALPAIDSFLQNGSAVVARQFFNCSGTPFFEDGLNFQLPDITLQIAPECSGIHSTLVLLITGLLAGYFFLKSPWKRTLLAVVVIPLALLRNGFRVFTIGELCVHIGPQMINSPIHRKGGPIFFALSLIPLFLLLLVLYKSERNRKHQNP